MTPPLRQFFLILSVTVSLLSLTSVNTSAQKAGKFEIDQWRDVLRNVQRELKERYYDPKFHGIDIDARFELADAKMKNAASLPQLVGIVAQVLLDLNDSHTYFIPPFNKTRVDYGWHMKSVGSDCYVSAVRPKSDAEGKGLRAGDKLLSIDGRTLDRTKVWLASYLYNTLRPQSTVTLLVEKPDKSRKEIVIKAKVREGSAMTWYSDKIERDWEAKEDYSLIESRFHELSDEVLIWKMPLFELSDDRLADAYGKFKNRKVLILDLRGNSGGYVSVVEKVAGFFFDSNMKIADFRGRKAVQPMKVRSQRRQVFKGKLIVLIDGDSASGAEIFARFVQLEKRGIVIGDRSSGSVMRSRRYRLQVGDMEALGFAISATDADVIMSDGKSLEHIGVTPDELLLPTAQEMSLNLDPILSYAASLAGVQLHPQKAGTLFPIEWKQ
jgi:C-terminal processing protease CtpA/Prc